MLRSIDQRLPFICASEGTYQNDLNEEVDGGCNLERSAWGIYFNGGNNDGRSIESVNNAVLGLVRIAGG